MDNLHNFESKTNDDFAAVESPTPEQWNTVSIFSGLSRLGGAIGEPERPPADYAKVAKNQQVEVRVKNENDRTQYEFYTKIDGKDAVVLSSNQSPETVERQLKQAQQAKLDELEKTYGVDIADDGETTKSINEKKDLPVTKPTVGELAAIEDALLHSVPDTKTTTGNPLRIVVGDETKSWKDDFGGGGVRRGDEIVIAYQTSLSYLKEVGVHELAHVGQNQREKTAGYESYAVELGWAKAGDDWLLKGKDGSFWQNTGRDGLWIRTDSDGNPADSNGNRVDNKWNPFDHGEDTNRVQTKKDTEVREIALVKPYSTYFGNPHEMGAAMLTPFRDNRELRAALYKVSADSYQVAKNLDQYQIDFAYGKQSDGQPKYIRNPDGIVAENNEENRIILKEFEDSLRESKS